LNHLTLEYTNPSSSSWKEARWHIDDKERARIRKVFGSKQKEIGVLGPDGQTMWYDAKLLGVEGKGWVDTESYYDRLPQKAKHTVRKPVWNLNHHTAGMLIRFATDAKKLQVRWTLTNKRLAMPHMPATGVSGIDLYARDQLGILRFSANGRPTEVTNKASFMLPASKEYVLYLPLYNGVKLLEIGITKEKSLSKVPSPSHSIVFYIWANSDG
jgi:hypothetical protein